jgi:hypothetical protein
MGSPRWHQWYSLNGTVGGVSASRPQGEGGMSMFDVDQFIAQLRATLPERSRQAMKEVVAQAVSDPASPLRQIGKLTPGGSRCCIMPLT